MSLHRTPIGRSGGESGHAFTEAFAVELENTIEALNQTEHGIFGVNRVSLFRQRGISNPAERVSCPGRRYRKKKQGGC